MGEPSAIRGDLVQLNVAMPAELRRAIHVLAAQHNERRQAVVCTILADALGVPLPADLRAGGLALPPHACPCPN